MDCYEVDLDEIENGIYQGCAETTFLKVEVEVDAISGAASSSQVIKSAVRDALANAAK